MCKFFAEFAFSSSNVAGALEQAPSIPTHGSLKLHNFSIHHVQNSIIKPPNLITFQCKAYLVHYWSHQIRWEFPVLDQKVYQCTCEQNRKSSLWACSRSVGVISLIENQNVEWRHSRPKDSREGWLRDVCTRLQRAISPEFEHSSIDKLSLWCSQGWDVTWFLLLFSPSCKMQFPMSHE